MFVLQEHVEARGGEVRVNAPLKSIEINDDNTVKGLRMLGADGKEGELIQVPLPGHNVCL